MKGGIKRGWDYGDDGKTPLRWTGNQNVIPIFTEPDFMDLKRGTVLDIGSGIPLGWNADIYNVQFPTCPAYNNTTEKMIHSAQKPVLLLGMLVMLSSNVGETVLDCFGGSMTTGVASVICDRNFIGIEREAKTYEDGRNRIMSTPYDRWEKYFEKRLSSSEPFKFGFASRSFMKKMGKDKA
jgi:DNA modification methylase